MVHTGIHHSHGDACACPALLVGVVCVDQGQSVIAQIFRRGRAGIAGRWRRRGWRRRGRGRRRRGSHRGGRARTAAAAAASGHAQDHRAQDHEGAGADQNAIQGGLIGMAHYAKASDTSLNLRCRMRHPFDQVERGTERSGVLDARSSRYGEFRIPPSGLVAKGRSVLGDDVHDRLVRVFDDPVVVRRHVEADVRRLPQLSARKA